MEEKIEEKLAALSEKIVDATHRVSSLLDDEQPPPAEIDRAHSKVEDVAQMFRDLIAGVPEEERDRIERSHGRRVTDLRRLDGQLPDRATGRSVAKAADASPFDQPFLTVRKPPPSIEPARDTGWGRAAGYRVGGTVEAWCGPCNGITDHSIVAMVDGQPKQVICGPCGARHGYRTEPPRKKRKSEPKTKKPTPEQLAARKHEEERLALAKELAEATDVRPFRTRERYRSGQIIEHPEHGRGKIDAVVRGAIVVRFRDGVRSLTTL